MHCVACKARPIPSEKYRLVGLIKLSMPMAELLDGAHPPWQIRLGTARISLRRGSLRSNAVPLFSSADGILNV